MRLQRLMSRADEKLLICICAVLTAMSANAANAAPVHSGIYADMYLKQNTFPSGLSEEKVYMDQNTAGTVPVVGHIGSQTDAREVHFLSSTDTLTANSNGFGAVIEATDGLINEIRIVAPGYWFEDLIFNVNFGPHYSKDLTVIAVDKNGGQDSFSGWALGNGENEILVLSTAGNLMQEVVLQSSIGMQSITGLDELKQIEISGVTAVPIPAAAWLFGSGLIALAGIARRKQS